MSELYEASESPRMTRAVQWLLALNIGVYFLQLTLFGQDAVYSALALDPARFPANWWTVVTYMFVHAWLAHLAFNMFTLWMFGPRLEHEWGTRMFVWFYLFCGVGGAIAHLVFAQHTAVIGPQARSAECWSPTRFGGLTKRSIFSALFQCDLAGSSWRCSG